MKRTKRLSALIAVTMMAIVTLVQTASAQSRDERAVREASQAWLGYVRSQQVDSIVALHMPDAVMMMANSPPTKGSNAIRSGWGEMVKLPNLKMQWTPEKIEVTSPTTATEYGTYTDSYDGPNGTESDAGTYLTIWKKVNGKWRVAYDAPVSSKPAAAATAATPATPATSATTATTATMAVPAASEMGDGQLIGNDKIVFNDFSVPGFDPGVKLAVVHGDPMGKGDYTMRLMFPDGYKFPVHFHPGAEHLTVISGTFLLAMGTDGDWSKVQTYAPGSFIYAPARHPHYGGARGVTVVQLHGQAPFAVVLGAPK